MTSHTFWLAVISFIPGTVYGYVCIAKLESMLRQFRYSQIFSIRNKFGLATFLVGFLTGFSTFFLYNSNPSATEPSFRLFLNSCLWALSICVLQEIDFESESLRRISPNALLKIVLTEVSQAVIRKYRSKSIEIASDMVREIRLNKDIDAFTVGVMRLEAELRPPTPSDNDADPSILAPSEDPYKILKEIREKRSQAILSKAFGRFKMRKTSTASENELMKDLMEVVSFLSKEQMSSVLSGFGCKRTLKAFELGKGRDYASPFNQANKAVS